MDGISLSTNREVGRNGPKDFLLVTQTTLCARSRCTCSLCIPGLQYQHGGAGGKVDLRSLKIHVFFTTLRLPSSCYKRFQMAFSSSKEISINVTVGEQVAECHRDTSVGVRVLGLCLIHRLWGRVLLRPTWISCETVGAGEHPALADI